MTELILYVHDFKNINDVIEFLNCVLIINKELFNKFQIID